MDTLPDLAIINILRMACEEPWQLLRLREVCRRWRDLAMVPQLWRLWRFPFCGLYRDVVPVLRHSACVSELSLRKSFSRILKTPDPHPEVLAEARTMRCAVQKLEVSLERSTATALLEVVRNQVALGRMEELSAWMERDLEADPAVITAFLDVALGCRSLRSLTLCNEHGLPLATSAASSPPGCRLRQLTLSEESDCCSRVLWGLLAAHSGSLEELYVDSALQEFPWAELAACRRLRRLSVPAHPGLRNLRPSGVRELTLNSMYMCKTEEEVAALSALFAAGPAQQLDALALTDTHYKGLDAMLRWVQDLASTGKAAVQVLRIDPAWYTPEFNTPLTALAACLPALPRLRELQIPAPDADVLQAISPQRTPQLRLLELGTVCSGSAGCCVPALRELLRRNSRLHVCCRTTGFCPHPAAYGPDNCDAALHSAEAYGSDGH